MASHILMTFLYFLTITTTTTTTRLLPSSPSPPLPPPIQNTSTTTLLLPSSPSPPLPPPIQNTATNPIIHLNSIINFLNQTKDYNKWAHFLSQNFKINSTVPSIDIFPPFYTLFVPSNDAFLALKNPPQYLLLTHFVPLRFSLTSLLFYPNGLHLPTLYPHFSLVVTTNNSYSSSSSSSSSSSGLSINGAQVTNPNIFQDNLISVHGISFILEPTKTKTMHAYDLYFWKSLTVVLFISFVASKMAGGKPHLVLDVAVFGLICLGREYRNSEGDEIRTLLTHGFFSIMLSENISNRSDFFRYVAGFYWCLLLFSLYFWPL